jgi:hypothetical protein
MGIGMIIIKKAIDGEEFSNTYAFQYESGLAQLGPADLTAIGAETEITDVNTTPSLTDAPFLLHRLIGFDRLLTHTSVTYLEVYVTDGTRNETDPGNVFFTAPLDFLGLWSSANPAPGSITLLIQRVPAGFSARKGRLFMRGSLDESEIRFGGDALVTWQTPGTRTTVITRVNNAVSESELNLHFNDEFGGPGPVLVIPHFDEVALPDNKIGRNLVSGTPIARLTAYRPNARQVKKGRKEK